MQRLLLAASAAFILGLVTGSFATSQLDLYDPEKETRPLGKQDAIQSDISTQAGGAVLGSAALVKLPGVAQSEPNRQTDGPLDVTIESMSDEVQLEVLVSRWAELEALVGRLVVRVDSLERETVAGPSPDAIEPLGETGALAQVLPVDTPDDRRTALVSVGVPEAMAEEIVWRQSEMELERLELQDQAIREGWFRSDRYYKTLRELSAEELNLRAEIGEQAYDQYLYRTGQSNRMKVTALIQGSAAEQSGLIPGDVIESYDGAPVFSLSDLRTATTQGSRDELVPVIIRRDGNLFETNVLRGPMGVRVEVDSVSPND